MSPRRVHLRLGDAAGAPIAAGAHVALGNFDGVHRGHQAVIARAAAAGGDVAAAVFTPHPRAFFRPDGPPLRLQSDDQRARALHACGVSTVIEIAFDAELAALSPQAFAAEVLKTRIGAAGVAVGLDFRFGQGRAGTVETLRAEGARLGFAVAVADAVDDADHPGDKISSSAIRAALAEGDVDLAGRLLGRPFSIEGMVIEGAKRGRTIDFPTANVALGSYVRPAFGVYAVRARLADGAKFGGVANLGVKPTVAQAPEAPLLETHLFDFSGDLYGRVLEVELIWFLRAERKFESFAALTEQIGKDAAAARVALGEAS